MKNIRQLVELNYIDDNDIRKLFENEYQDDVTSCDNYFRYYPNDDSYDESNEATKKINEWLIKEGYELNVNDEYFHLLIRWDW